MKKERHQADRQRVDVVFIRKSTDQQDERPQVANVANMLRGLGVHVAERHWFTGTVSRRKVKGNEPFTRMLSMVEAGHVRRLFVESQDRWGTPDRAERYELLTILRESGTALIDLRENKDLTTQDFSTELLAFIKSIKSELELKDLSYRSLRTRVNKFKDESSWPGGVQPFGYDKANHDSQRVLLWVWHPTTSRHTGQIHYAEADGLTPGPHCKIPKKAKTDIMLLRPSVDGERVETVKLMFGLYRDGLSLRQVAYRLNSLGSKRTHYGKPWSFHTVRDILENSAYIGDTHFGKVKRGDGLNTFDREGTVKPIDPTQAPEAGVIIRKGTHEALIDQTTWDRVQERLERESTRENYQGGRNAAYWLKPLFRCGHCGANMTGRSYSDPRSKAKTISYVCLTYVRGQASGVQGGCGYHAIKHEDAERLLLHKMESMGLAFDEAGTEGNKALIEQRERLLGEEANELRDQWADLLTRGVQAYAEHLGLRFGFSVQPFWFVDDLDNAFAVSLAGLAGVAGRATPGDDLRERLKVVERQANAEAARLAAEAEKEYAELTRVWAKASEAMQGVLKADLDELERKIAHYRREAVPIWDRMAHVDEALKGRLAEMEQLRQAWPEMEGRAKAEALQRIFKRVTLWWDRTWHPASNYRRQGAFREPKGRYSYALDTGRIDRDGFEFTSILSGSDSPGTCSRSGR
jgi:DNA invertase Pin-like site-specific DNA recombinase